MQKEEKYFKWIDLNIKNIKEKVVLLNGVTGGIGSSIATYLSYLKNDLIILVRNIIEVKKIKNDLENRFHNKIEVIYFDYLDDNSLINTLNYIKNLSKLDYFINISGIYHQNYQLINGIEKTYQVNFFKPSFFINELFKINKNLNVVITSSITSLIKLKNKDDLFKDEISFINNLNNIKNKTKRYAFSKHLLNSYLLYLKEKENKNITIAHPGIAVTKLFDKKNKAYPKIFYIFIPSLMKIIFMDSSKASLSILKASDYQNTLINKWIGPRGLFHSWGYPKIYNLNKNLLDSKENEKIYLLTNKVNLK